MNPYRDDFFYFVCPFAAFHCLLASVQRDRRQRQDRQRQLRRLARAQAQHMTLDRPAAVSLVSSIADAIKAPASDASLAVNPVHQ